MLVKVLMLLFFKLQLCLPASSVMRDELCCAVQRMCVWWLTASPSTLLLMTGELDVIGVALWR